MLRFLRVGAVFGLVLALMMAFTASASAHETRDVGAAKYQMIVGFMVEPPTQSIPNGVDLRVRTKGDNQPIEGVEKTLKVEVMFGADKQSMDLKTVSGTPGRYKAEFIPSKPGTYKF